MLLNKVLTLAFVTSIGFASVASAQADDAPTAPATPDRKVTTLLCGGFRFSAVSYVNAAASICFDRHLRRYLVSFAGGGISSSAMQAQGFILRVRDNGSVAGIYKGSNVAGVKAGRVGVGGGVFAKSDALLSTDLTGSALMFGINKGLNTDPGGFDIGAQTMIITPIQ